MNIKRSFFYSGTRRILREYSLIETLKARVRNCPLPNLFPCNRKIARKNKYATSLISLQEMTLKKLKGLSMTPTQYVRYMQLDGFLYQDLMLSNPSKFKAFLNYFFVYLKRIKRVHLVSFKMDIKYGSMLMYKILSLVSRLQISIIRFNFVN
jgi:hypothetical protein